MGFCTQMAANFVGLVSVIMLLISLVTLGTSAYVAATFGGELTELELNNPVLVGAIFGASLFVLSVIGLVGVCKDVKCLLFIYLIGSMFISFGIIVAGGVFISQTQTFDNVKANEFDQDAERIFLNFELAIFDVCCEETVPPCADDVVAKDCASDEVFDTFVAFFEDNEASATCTTLEQFNNADGVVFVNDAAPGTDDVCSEGAPAFVDDINQLFTDNVKLVGGSLIGTGVVMFLLMIATCLAICRKKEEEK